MVPGPAPDAAARVAEVARAGHGRLIALLVRSDGDLAGAEDALADAYEAALQNWADDPPRNPEAWLLTVARNRQRDRWKSAAHRRSVALDPQNPSQDAATPEEGRAPSEEFDDPARYEGERLPDRRLALLAVCAHPAIDRAAHTPLMLNTVLGFTAEQIGEAMVVPRATMASRLVRAKRRIKQLGIRFEVPGAEALGPRLEAIREAVYGTFAIEWATADTQPRESLAAEAMFLAELLTELLPDDAESHGLAALIEFSAARFAARGTTNFVPLAEQDPRRWDARLIEKAEGHLQAGHLRVARSGGELGRFQFEAAIQAVHCARRHTGATDWTALLRLHRGLQRLAPSVGGAVSLAAVLAECEGPESGLAALDELADRTSGFQPAWATRAHLLTRAGRADEAAAAYRKAISLTTVPAEREHLQRRLSTR